MIFKPKLYTIKNSLIAFIIFLIPMFSYTAIKGTCFDDVQDVLPVYFSVQSQLLYRPQQLDDLFTCIDKTLELMVNHTTTKNPGTYSQIELRRLIRLLSTNTTKQEANQISIAVIDLKYSIIGGKKHSFNLTDIDNLKKILFVIKERMKAIHFVIPTFVKILNNQKVPRSQLVQATNTLTYHLKILGNQLSKISFVSNLSALKNFPYSMRTLGFLKKVEMNNWSAALVLLSQVKSMLLQSPKHLIQKKEWPVFLHSAGKLISIWIYYQNFFTTKYWMSMHTVQHSQYLLSRFLNFVRDTKKRSANQNIYLHEIDELARKLWFVPEVSQPIFRLGLRSMFCFLLNPLVTKKTCKHNLDFKNKDLKISFSDLEFTINDTNIISESRTQNTSDKIQLSHLNILRQYLDQWIIAENKLRETYQLPTNLFGSPHQWLTRNISLTSDRRLLFSNKRTYNISLLSQLNWQSHLMKFFVSAYTTRKGEKVTTTLWNTIIKEWTAFNVYLTKDANMPWRHFQQLGFKTLKHGDFLTSHSNGDQILQEKEILELFSLFTSSFKTATLATKILQRCENDILKQFNASCVWSYLYKIPPSIFTGFPLLTKEFIHNKKKKIQYISVIYSANQHLKTLSFNDLFEIFLFIHYQENTLEFLDQNLSQSLNATELKHYLEVFQSSLINNIPFVYNKHHAFSFITYVFYYGEIPIFNKNNTLSSPVRFSNWILHPKKWRLNIKRKDIFHTLFLLNNKFAK